MAVSKVMERWTFPVTEALGNLTPLEKQFRFVSLATTGTVGLAASGASAVFVLEDTPKAGEKGTVVLLGVAKVRLAEKVEAGQLAGSNNTGEAQVAKSGQFVQGTFLTGGEKGSLVPILVHSGSGAKVP